MGNWVEHELEWTGRVPTPEQCQALTDAMSSADSGFPTLSPSGFHSTWRSPSLGAQDAIDALHYLGFPCRGRRGIDYPTSDDQIRDLTPWLHSKPTMDGVPAYRRTVATRSSTTHVRMGYPWSRSTVARRVRLCGRATWTAAPRHRGGL